MKASDRTLRQYLLGDAGEDVRDAVERSYFDDPGELQRLEAAEEALIEAYLAGELDLAAKAQFEREHLSSPHRRRRVETIRRLTERPVRAALADRARPAWPVRYAALAASLLIAVAVGWWFLSSAASVPPPSESRASSAPAPRPPAAESPGAVSSPPVLALALFPVSTRSAGQTPVAALDARTGTLRLELQGDHGLPPVRNGRVVVQTVEGNEVWRGVTEVGAERRNAPVAWVSIPAARLAADDYVVILLDPGRGLEDQERYRYFFRVRRP